MDLETNIRNRPETNTHDGPRNLRMSWTQKLMYVMDLETSIHSRPRH